MRESAENEVEGRCEEIVEDGTDRTALFALRASRFCAVGIKFVFVEFSPACRLQSADRTIQASKTMKPNDPTHATNDAPRYHGKWSYLEVCGTNIEDLDLALKSTRSIAGTTEQAERPVSG
jgi:hypothetical protein